MWDYLNRKQNKKIANVQRQPLECPATILKNDLANCEALKLARIMQTAFVLYAVFAHVAIKSYFLSKIQRD